MVWLRCHSSFRFLRTKWTRRLTQSFYQKWIIWKWWSGYEHFVILSSLVVSMCTRRGEWDAEGGQCVVSVERRARTIPWHGVWDGVRRQLDSTRRRLLHHTQQGSLDAAATERVQLVLLAAILFSYHLWDLAMCSYICSSPYYTPAPETVMKLFRAFLLISSIWCYYIDSSSSSSSFICIKN